MLSNRSKQMCGVILISIPSIAYGGYFLLTHLSGTSGLELTSFQESMFRAGHAHAGILLILSLMIQFLVDQVKTSAVWQWISRVGVPTSALLISGGFFAAAIGEGITSPTNGIYLLYCGIAVLVVSLITLGSLLLKSSAQNK